MPRASAQADDLASAVAVEAHVTVSDVDRPDTGNLGFLLAKVE
jgi:hypothetical protein